MTIKKPKDYKEALFSEIEKFEILVENSPFGLSIINDDGRFEYINRTFTKMMGYVLKDIPTEKEWFKKAYPDKKYRKEVTARWVEDFKKKKVGQVRSSTFKVICKNKSTKIINFRPVTMKNKGQFIIYDDVTAVKKVEEQLKYLSFHDKLTDLYNRAYFEEEVKRLNTKRALPLSVVIGDINGLKLINDAFGHSTGDELLKKIAGILKKQFREEDIIARWGGDEFSILLPNTSESDTSKVIKRIKEACKKNSTKLMPLSISIGSSTKKDIKQNIKEVLKEAEDLMYRHKLIEHQSARSSVIASLEKALEEKDYETEEHIERMKDFVVKFGEKLNLDPGRLDELNLLVALHDIGKIAIADSILPKPSELTSEEWKIIKKHPEVGYHIAESSLELAPIAEGILYHHEWWNGKGYPRGLKKEKIPLISRVIAIVDAYDAMTNDRPYRKALNSKQAVDELKKGSGIQFDPHLVKVFITLLPKS